MKRKELIIPLSQIQNLLPTPVSCYAYGGEIITIPPTPIEEVKKGFDVYYIVDKIPSTPFRPNLILAYPPEVGCGGKEVRRLFIDKIRCYPVGDA